MGLMCLSEDKILSPSDDKYTPRGLSLRSRSWQSRSNDTVISKICPDYLVLSNNLLCPLCGTDYNMPYHLLCLCPSFADLRHKFFGDFVLSLE